MTWVRKSLKKSAGGEKCNCTPTSKRRRQCVILEGHSHGGRMRHNVREVDDERKFSVKNSEGMKIIGFLKSQKERSIDRIASQVMEKKQSGRISQDMSKFCPNSWKKESHFFLILLTFNWHFFSWFCLILSLLSIFLLLLLWLLSFPCSSLFLFLLQNLCSQYRLWITSRKNCSDLFFLLSSDSDKP